MGIGSARYWYSEKAGAISTYLLVLIVRLTRMVLAPQEIKIAAFPAWIRNHLLLSEWVALEDTNNSWDIHDQLENYVQDVLVANTSKLGFAILVIIEYVSVGDSSDAFTEVRLYDKESYLDYFGGALSRQYRSKFAK